MTQSNGNAVAEHPAAMSHTPPPSSKIDWKNLGFNFRPTNGYLKYTWSAQTNRWDEGQTVREPYLNMHICATAINYGQEAFEGLKAFRCKDGRVRLFRPDENAARLARSAARLAMVAPPTDLFLRACYRAVNENVEYVPPYGSGGSLYIRPLLLGSGPQLGLVPADEFVFIVYVVPVAPFYATAGTLVKPVKALIPEDFDRAAPMGSGDVKAGGNYAPAMAPTMAGKRHGYSVLLFLDAKTRTYIEEFSSANFLAIAHDADRKQQQHEHSTPTSAPCHYTIVAPQSNSILPSITTMSLLTLAERTPGFKVERRPVEWREVAEGGFREVCAAGTAVILTPVNQITLGDTTVTCGPDEGLGEGFQALYDRIVAIQAGDEEDTLGWMAPTEGVTAWKE